MIEARIANKTTELIVGFAFFFTPLLFFSETKDQFELPKLVFLAILAAPLSISLLKNRASSGITPLSTALFLLFAVQTAASLPSTSLSWRTSLLGDYENFSGLATLLTFLLWFFSLSRVLTEKTIWKVLHFNSLAALFSSFYAFAQRFQFDFIQWNPESINSSREFASLGNPNFLSAYLAISIPLYLCVIQDQPIQAKVPRSPGPFFWLLGTIGLFLLFLGTPQGLSILGLPPEGFPRITCRNLGFGLFSLFALRLSLVPFPGRMPLGLLILFSGIFCTGSRGGFLGALAGAGLWYLLTFKSGGTAKKVPAAFNRLSKPVLAIVLLFPTLVLLFFGRSFLPRLWTSLVHVGNSLETSRLHIWGPALKMIQAHPFLGVGLDTFKITFPFYSGVDFNRIDGIFVSSRTAHNELLQITATTGFLGLAAYLALLSAFVWTIWKTWNGASLRTRGLLIAILAGALAYQVQNLFSFGVAGLNLLWFFFLATVQSLYLKTREKSLESSGVSLPQRTTSLSQAPIKVVLLLCLILILIFPMKRLAADIAFGRGFAASELLKKIDPQDDSKRWTTYSDYGIRHQAKAWALFPWEVKYLLYLGLAYEQRAPQEPNSSNDWYEKALDCYKKSIAFSPANAYYHNNKGRVFATLGRKDSRFLPQAEAAYRDAVQLAPNSPLFILNCADALRKNGKEQETQEALQKAFSLDPLFTSKVLDQMGLAEYETGDKTIAFQDLEDAIKGNPSGPEAYYYRGRLYLIEKKWKLALADFEKTRSLNPTEEKNPTVHDLDAYIARAKN